MHCEADSAPGTSVLKGLCVCFGARIHIAKKDVPRSAKEAMTVKVTLNCRPFAHLKSPFKMLLGKHLLG